MVKKPNLVKNQPPNQIDLIACMQCGYCRSVCPVFEETGWESLSPRGKLFVVKNLTTKNSMLERIIGKNLTAKIVRDVGIPLEELRDAIYKCTLCSRCVTKCHVEIPFHEMWEHIRIWMVENGIEPPEKTIGMYDNIANPEFNNPFMEPMEKRDEWYREDYVLPPKADIVYFIGCGTSFYEYQVLLGNMKIFTKAGVNFTTLGKDEICCNAVSMMTGQVENFAELAKRNVENIKKRGAKRVVTGCPGCYRSLKKYKKYVKFDFEIIHTMELIAELIKEGKLEFKKPFKDKDQPIIYHDPCELGRISEFEDHGIYDEPRFILKSVPGIDEIIEFPNCRVDSTCCGGGGGMKAVDYDLSAAIALKKVEQAIELGAKTIVSSCPNCKSQMGIAIEAKKKEYKDRGEKFKMKTMDVVEIVAKSI